MENNTNRESGLFSLSIEGSARELLQSAATWARIIAIVGFVSAGLTLLDTIIRGAGVGGFAMAGSVLFVSIILVVQVVLNIFLYRFASNTLESLNNMSQVQFNAGVGNLKTYFKMVGILIIIGIAICIIVVLAAIAGASFISR